MNSFDNNFALYEIASKALLHKSDEILLLTQFDGAHDFPGERMDKSEMDLELTDILSREIGEELGTNVKFKVNDIAFMSKRFYKSKGNEHYILAIYFNVDYISGEIVLSDEHTHFSWVKPKDILSTPDKFVTEHEYKMYREYILTH